MMVMENERNLRNKSSVCKSYKVCGHPNSPITVSILWPFNKYIGTRQFFSLKLAQLTKKHLHRKPIQFMIMCVCRLKMSLLLGKNPIGDESG